MKQPKTPKTPSRAASPKLRLALVVMDEGQGAKAEGVAPQAALARDEAVRRAAYALYEARGGAAGNELDDWLQAEAQVSAALATDPAAPH